MKKFINKKNVVIAVIVAILIGVSAYMLANKKSDVKTNTEKTSEVTTKEDKKNEVKNDKKTDEKKSDKKEVKEDKKSDEMKSDTKVEETSNTESNTTSIATETTNNNVSNTTSNNTSYAQPTSTPCVPTYATINHPEQGHYETQVVTPAWDEAVYDGKIVGGQTGRVYNSLNEFMNQEEDYSYSVKQVQVDTIHHEAVTQQVWVVDQQTWNETVASGC